MCVHVCICVQAHVWRSENYLWSENKLWYSCFSLLPCGFLFGSMCLTHLVVCWIYLFSDRVSFCSPGCCRTQSSPLVFPSRILRLEACTNTPNFHSWSVINTLAYVTKSLKNFFFFLFFLEIGLYIDQSGLQLTGSKEWSWTLASSASWVLAVQVCTTINSACM